MTQRLSATPTANAAELAALALGGQVTLYVGSGLSAGTPTNMPTSRQLVGLLRPIFEGMGVNVEEAGTQRSLEDIADEVEAIGRIGELKERIATMDVFRRPPNDGHSALAILMSEGVASVLSANWDEAVERASAKNGFYINRTITDTERLASRFKGGLHKLHGCVSRPSSLLISHQDLSNVPIWARNEAEAAMSGGVIVFVGIGTVADYVAERIRYVLAIAGDAATVWVVATTVSETWRAILDTHLGSKVIQDEAGLFLDDLLRAVVLAAFERAGVTAEAMIGAGAATEELRDNMRTLRTAFLDADAPSAWKWLTGGELSPEVGVPSMHSDEAIRALLAIAMIAGPRNPSVAGGGTTIVLRADGAYLEVTIGHNPPAPDLVDAERARAAERRRHGHYSELDLPIVHVCSGHVGTLPAPETVQDLVGTGSPINIVDGPDAGIHYWVAADLVLGGQTVELPWTA